MRNLYKRKVREALHRLKNLNEKDETFKVLNREYSDYATTNRCTLFWKIELNYNFDIKFCVSLKTAFSKLSRNINTC